MLEVMGGISSGLRAHGYDLLLIHADKHDNDWADGYLGTGRVDGFIVVWASCTAGQIEDLIEPESAVHHVGPRHEAHAGTAP